MRIILYTGKGGVGKTSVSAATALGLAERGYRTLVMSTDAAHSLADSFDIPLGHEPVEVTKNLWAQEVSVLHEVDRYWITLQQYITTLLSWRGMEDVVAEEMTVLPGAEELAGLVRIVKHYESGLYDAIVVDCAPTGDTLRLLSFPDIARWWLEKLFPIQRQAAKVLRPFMRAVTDMPMPEDDVFESIKHLLTQLDRIHALLADPATVFFHGKTEVIEPTEQGFLLKMPLPLARKEQLELMQTGDELVVQVGDYKRNIILPRALATSHVAAAKLEEGELRITFVR